MKSYRSVLENFMLPFADFCLRTEFIKSLNRWRKIQSLSDEELSRLQNEKIEKILSHAISNVSFYKKQREKFLTNGKPDIRKFPILKKKIIKQNLNDLLWHPSRKNELICERSSGSSGVQGEVYMSRFEQSNIQAVQTLMWEWAGYSFGKTMLQTGMTLKRGFIKSLKDFFLRTRYQSAFGLDERQILKVLRNLQRKPVKVFGGYASSLYVYAQVARNHNIENVQFESVISWGDKMFPHYRSLIENQFHTQVYDTYGASEGFMIAAQFDIDYYYIVSPFVFVELVNDDGEEVRDGEMGYVVVTALDAYEMPLIRYYLGDIAIKVPRNEFPSNRLLKFPLLKQIIGRDTDIVKTPSGKNMIVHFFTAIFEHYPEISQFQVVQENIDSMKILYIKGCGFNENVLVTIKSKIDLYLDESFQVLFEEVEGIANSPSGKPQIILSKLK